jgi:hypothetical protein
MSIDADALDLAAGLRVRRRGTPPSASARCWPTWMLRPARGSRRASRPTCSCRAGWSSGRRCRCTAGPLEADATGLRRILSHPPADEATRDFRHQILGELAASPSLEHELVELHRELRRLRASLLRPPPEGADEGTARRIQILGSLAPHPRAARQRLRRGPLGPGALGRAGRGARAHRGLRAPGRSAGARSPARHRSAGAAPGRRRQGARADRGAGSTRTPRTATTARRPSAGGARRCCSCAATASPTPSWWTAGSTRCSPSTPSCCRGCCS